MNSFHHFVATPHKDHKQLCWSHLWEKDIFTSELHPVIEWVTGWNESFSCSTKCWNSNFFFFYRSEAQFSAQCRQRHPHSSCVISWHMLHYSVCFSLLFSALTAAIMNDLLGPQYLEYCCIKSPIICFLGGRNSGRTQCLTLATVLWRCGHRVVMKR